MVGAGVGSFEGIDVGARLGTVDGSKEVVGNLLGASVGCRLGKCVGSKV